MHMEISEGIMSSAEMKLMKHNMLVGCYKVLHTYYYFLNFTASILFFYMLEYCGYRWFNKIPCASTCTTHKWLYSFER